jgi:hypothetical protein
MICTLIKYYSCPQVKNIEIGWTCNTYGRQERRTQGFGEDSSGKEQFGRPKHGWEDNINVILKKLFGEAYTGLVWLRIGTGGGHL